MRPQNNDALSNFTFSLYLLQTIIIRRWTWMTHPSREQNQFEWKGKRESNNGEHKWFNRNKNSTKKI